MSASQDEISAWALRQVQEAGSQGLLFRQLLSQFDVQYQSRHVDVGGKDGFLRALLANEDLLIEEPLVFSLEGLEVENLLAEEGLKIVVKPENRSKTTLKDTSHSLQSETNHQHPASSSVQAITQITAISSNEDVPTAPIKPKRGRKPKAKPSSTELDNVAGNAAVTEDAPTAILPAVLSTGRVSGRLPKPRVFYEEEMQVPVKPKDGPKLKDNHKAVYTSYEDMTREEDDSQRAAGIARVYINPPGSEKPKSERKKWERVKKHIIAVFKSERLKEPKWLEEHQGCGSELLNFIRQGHGAVQQGAGLDRAQSLDKRKRTSAEGDTSSKPRKRRKGILESTPVPVASGLLESSNAEPLQTSTIPDNRNSIIEPQTPVRVPLPASAPYVALNLQQNHTAAPSVSQQPSPPSKAPLHDTVGSAVPHQIRVPTQTAPITPLVAPLQTLPNSQYVSPYGTTSDANSKDSLSAADQQPVDYSTTSQNISPLSSVHVKASNPAQQSNLKLAQTSQHPATVQAASKTIEQPNVVADPSVEASPETLHTQPQKNSTPSDAPLQPYSQTLDTPRVPANGYVSPYGLSQQTSHGILATSPETIPKAPSQQVYNHRPVLGRLPPGMMSDPPHTIPANLSDLPSTTDLTSRGTPDHLSGSLTPKKSRSRKRKMSEGQHNKENAESSKKVKRQKAENVDQHPSRRLLSAAALPTNRNSLPDLYADALSVPLPDITCRISVAHNDVYGNLYVSEDKNTVHFLATGDQQPSLNIDVHSITENPITSMPKSKPMEIRLKVRGESRIPTTYRFRFASTEEAYTAANKFRADVVTAMIKDSMKATDDVVEIALPEEEAKPFKCDKCGSRYKNKEGIIYHHTRSQTSCNPNFVKGTEYVRRAPVRRKRIDSHSKASKHLDKSTDDPGPDKDSEDSDSSSNSSDDSIFEWAAKVAAQGGEKTTPKALEGGFRPSPWKRASQSVNISALKLQEGHSHEVPVEQAILQELVQSTESTADTMTHDQQAVAEPNPPDVREIIEASVSERSGKIVCELIEANGGVFPGERGLWYAFVAAWLKRHAQSKILPAYQLCLDTVDGLLENGELQRFSHNFEDEQGQVCSRFIVAKPGIDETSQPIQLLKSLMEQHHPQAYVPDELAPAKPIMEKLKSLAKGVEIDAAGQWEVGRRRARLQSELLQEDHSTEEEFVLDEAAEVEDDPTGEDGLSDGEFEHKSKPKTRVRRRRNGLSKYSVGHLLGDDYQPFVTRGKRTNGQDMPWKGVKFARQNPSKRKAAAASSSQTWWKKSSTFLPNPKTGAWNLHPYRARKDSADRRYRLPEPITFMQVDDGSWCFRPYGHGVKPIFTRPTRSDKSKPTSRYYRRSLEASFRPVLEPNQALRRGSSQPTNQRRSSNSSCPSPSNWSGSDVASDLDAHSPSVGNTTRLNIFGKGRGRPRKSIGTARVAVKSEREYRPRKRLTSKDPHKGISAQEKSVEESKSLSTPGPQFDELQILNHFEPPKLDPLVGRQANPGLASLPAEYASPVMLELHFLPTNARLGADDMELESPKAQNRVPVKVPDKIQWLEETAFTMDSLPYHDLPDEDADAFGSASPLHSTQQLRGRTITGKRKPDLGSDGGKMTFQRRQTSLDTDLDGCLDDSCFRAYNDEFLQLRYVVRPYHNATRQRQTEGQLSFELEARLIAAVVAIRTLTGGVELLIDWVLVGTLFPQHSMSYISRNWSSIAKKREHMIEKLSIDFQEAFLMGYRDGQVDPVDYENLMDYNWSKLVDWLLETVDIEWGNEYVDLPASKADLDRIYDFTSQPDTGHLTESYFNLLTPMYKRMEIVSGQPRATPIRAEEKKPIDFDTNELALAMTWVKAVTLTPEHQFDAVEAGKKLQSLSPKLVENAISALILTKIISRRKGKSNSRRPYEATDNFLAPLRKHINEKIYMEGVRYKIWLDEQFQSGLPCVAYPYIADEGVTMVVTNLQAHGRIKLRGRDIPMDPWGLTEKRADGTRSYETRKMDKSQFIFPLDIYPTDTYLYNSEIDVHQTILATKPPCGSPRGELPIWYSISGELNEDMWKKVLASVTGVVAMRTPIDREALKKCFTPALDEWEVDKLVDWGSDVGLWTKIVDHAGLWNVSEWWWLAVGRVCLGGVEDLQDGNE